MNINVSLNKTLSQLINERIDKSGYSNISEYIRDLLRHDLHLVHDDSDNYPYDYEYIQRIGDEAMQEYRAGETKKLTSLKDLIE